MTRCHSPVQRSEMVLPKEQVENEIKSQNLYQLLHSDQILTSHTNTLTMYTGSPVTRGDREGIKGQRTWIIGPRGVPKDVGLPVAVMAVPLERECGANPSPRDACKREGLDKSLAKRILAFTCNILITLSFIPSQNLIHYQSGPIKCEIRPWHP